MNDRYISMSSFGILATLAWLTAAALVAAGIAVDRSSVGQFGLLAAGGGMVLNVRAGMSRVAERERNAFELGRTYGRAEGDTPIRLVR